ncbi:MAG: hypothetical protein LBU97_05780 [Alistipes sp.]|nr:hypothetical protein [Alistipes sp.]
MKRNLIFMAAAAVFSILTLSACQDESPRLPHDPTGTEGNILMSLSFELSAADGCCCCCDGGSGSGDGSGSGGSGGVEGSDIPVARSVDVFVFDAEGRLAEVGGHTRFDSMEAFSRTDMGHGRVLYELDGHRIEASPDARMAYVGVNLPASVFVDFAGDRSEMLYTIEKVMQRPDLRGATASLSEAMQVVTKQNAGEGSTGGPGSGSGSGSGAGAGAENEAEMHFFITVKPWETEQVEVVW